MAHSLTPTHSSLHCVTCDQVSGLCRGGYSDVLLVQDSTMPTFAGSFAAMKVTNKAGLKRNRDKRRLRNELQALSQMAPSNFILAVSSLKTNC